MVTGLGVGGRMIESRYWQPTEVFDWDTAGRALSEEEERILRRLLVEEKKYQRVRKPRIRREHFDQE